MQALILACASVALQAPPQFTDSIRTLGLTQLGAYSMLRELAVDIGPRLSGSANAARAVEWGRATMQRLGFENIRLVPCMSPHWVRGTVEECTGFGRSGAFSLTCCALGSSPGTPIEGVTGEVIEVHSLDEAAKLGERAKGKILFFNRPFESALVSTGAQYGRAGDQRFSGPAAAARLGAAACLVRSMTGDPDDVPHTGTTRFEEGGPRVPAAALSIVAAERLTAEIKSGGAVSATIKLSCQTLPDVESADVVGELVGTDKPNEVVVIGGHLDSWDKGQGAHDDGAGVCQSIEALRLLKAAGWKPKRTIRVVLFMDEEQRGSGSAAYAAQAKSAKEKHVAAIESDSGGFTPRSFGCSLKGSRKIRSWERALSVFQIDRIDFGGGGGADVGPLQPQGAVLFGLEPDTQRYFDYHHSDKDTLDKVNAREIELGALAMATLAWLISDHGV